MLQHLQNLVGNNFPQFETLFQDCVNSWYPGLHGVHVHIHTYHVWCVRLSLCSCFQSAGPIAVQKPWAQYPRYRTQLTKAFRTGIGPALWNQLQRLNLTHQTWYVCMCTCTPCSPGYLEFTRSWNKVSICGKLLPTRFRKCRNVPHQLLLILLHICTWPLHLISTIEQWTSAPSQCPRIRADRKEQVCADSASSASAHANRAGSPWASLCTASLFSALPCA